MIQITNQKTFFAFIIENLDEMANLHSRFKPIESFWEKFCITLDQEHLKADQV